MEKKLKRYIVCVACVLCIITLFAVIIFSLKYKKEIRVINPQGEIVPYCSINILDSKEKIVDTIITDTDGIAQTFLKPGNYFYNITDCPSEYWIDVNSNFSFKVFPLVNNNIVDITIDYKGSIQIQSVVYASNRLFTDLYIGYKIYDANKKLIDTIYTDTGIITIIDLKPGEYFYRFIGNTNIDEDKEYYPFTILEAGRKTIHYYL